MSYADIVYFWLVPKIAKKTREKIKRECKPGTLVVQYGTKLSDALPERAVLADPSDDGTAKFWFYRV